VAAAEATATLVDPAISRRKLERELDAWHESEQEYRSKGWLIVRHDDLVVEVAFAKKLQLGSMGLPLLVPTVRFDYANYDLWPPSLTFIDFFSGEPSPAPLPNAWLPTPQGAQNILLNYPNGKPFLCVRGTREFHDHPQHTGEPWALYRSQGAGALVVLCDLIATTITATVGGLGMAPVLVQQPPQQQIELALPPEIQAALMQAAQAQGQ
jgi:Predicted metal binding domain